jgi:predicted ester cyclase
MSDRQANEAVLVRLFEEFWNRQALDDIADVFTEDAVIHFGASDYVGHAGIVDDFARPFMAAFPDLNHEILLLLIDGDMASMRYRGTGHMHKDYGGVRASGQPFEYHGIAIFRLAQGRVAEVWSNSDMATWLAGQPQTGDG